MILIWPNAADPDKSGPLPQHVIRDGSGELIVFESWKEFSEAGQIINKEAAQNLQIQPRNWGIPYWMSAKL